MNPRLWPIKDIIAEGMRRKNKLGELAWQQRIDELLQMVGWPGK